MSKKSSHVMKARGKYTRFHHCACILYTENLASDWKIRLKNLNVPYCFCIHQGESEELKEHVHLMLMFPNCRGEETIKKLLNSLGAVGCGQPYASMFQEIYDPVEMYEYLIHNTADSKDKIQYSPSDRVCGNGFDIENYMSRHVKRKLKTDRFVNLVDLIIENPNLTNLGDFLEYLKSTYPRDYPKLWELVGTKTVFYIGVLNSNRYKKSRGEGANFNKNVLPRELLGED